MEVARFSQQHDKPAATQHYLDNVLPNIPKGSWDSHMHVVDPTAYPLHPDAQYIPQPHTVDQWRLFASSIGIEKIVLVQPSIYGNDNSCMLDALRQLGVANARAVVTFDPATVSEVELREWDKIGVRGVRINLQSVGKTLTVEELRPLLKQYARVIRPFDWVIQLYVPLNMCEALEEIVQELDGLRFCIDHFGHPPLADPKQTEFMRTGDPYDLPGFRSLISLLQSGNVYVKFSAPYRITKKTDFADLEAAAKEILRVAGKSSVVFATDWPHTRFDGLDISPWIGKALEWCDGDTELVQEIFRDNADRLWSARP